MSIRRILVLGLASTLLGACSSVKDMVPGVYRIDIQQGNAISEEMIGQLQPGMNKRQVGYIMGTPLLVDAFHNDRWDYVYSFQPGGEERQQKRLSLFFENDELAGVQGDYRPPDKLVVPEPKDEVVVVPPRDLDDTLWGGMKRWFASDSK